MSILDKMVMMKMMLVAMMMMIMIVSMGGWCVRALGQNSSITHLEAAWHGQTPLDDEPDDGIIAAKSKHKIINAAQGNSHSATQKHDARNIAMPHLVAKI